MKGKLTTRLSWTMTIVLMICIFSSVCTAQEPIKWKMTTTFTPNMMNIEGDRYFVKTVSDLTKGAMEIKFYEGDSIIPPFEVFGAVQNNVVQMGGHWPAVLGRKRLGLRRPGRSFTGVVAH